MWIVLLASLGLSAALLASVSLSTAWANAFHHNPESSIWGREITKSNWYYASHAASIGSLIIAGLLSLTGRVRNGIPASYVLWFTAFVVSGMLMAVNGLSMADAFSLRILGSTGPFICFISVLLFVGADRRNWPYIEKILFVLTVLLSVIVSVKFAVIGTVARPEARVNLENYLNTLFWLSAWLVLRSAPESMFRRVSRWIPFVLFAYGSFLVQTRLNFLMIGATLLIRQIVLRKRKESSFYSRLPFTFVVIIMILTVAIALDADLVGRTQLSESLNFFAQRLGEDTRTGQLIAFFQNVSVWDLAFGRGTGATWRWNTLDWAGGTDVGYLSLMFFGGLPLLVTYCAVHILPAFKVLLSNRSGLELSCAAVVVLWAIRMLSSSWPSLSLDNYLLLLFVGGCLINGRGSCAPRLERARTGQRYHGRK